MGSAKKKAALICEEREFSRLEDMASDHESEDAESEGITDVCDVLPEENMDSIFQTPQQELSHNANFRNENSSRQTLEDKFLNSISSKDFVRSEEKRHAFVKDFTQPESLRRPFRTMHTLRRVNSESSETDAEVVSALVNIYGPKFK
ncbi:uncharacterized protein LOC130742777 [Lotus japonicus]|uniref:uncharacterized protein LOC130742777 n=1 Tax=Lotus japonicus TaxID=34305 RepID=UPI00258C70D7|nr:uncharacterized protein LOC130742777 [Lotus japonicus]